MSKESIYDDGFNDACWDYAHGEVILEEWRESDVRAPKVRNLVTFWTAGYRDGLVEAERRVG